MRYLKSIWAAQPWQYNHYMPAWGAAQHIDPASQPPALISAAWLTLPHCLSNAEAEEIDRLQAGATLCPTEKWAVLQGPLPVY